MERLHTDVYCRAEDARRLNIRLAGALLACPEGTALAGRSAAKWYGAVVPQTDRVEVVVRPAVLVRRPGIRARQARVSAQRVWKGLPVTTPEQTFADLARELPLVDLVVVGDGLVKRRVTSPERLVAAMVELPGDRGRAARRAAAYVREGVDSPKETRVRMLVVLAGLPEPQVNIVLERDRETGQVLRRTELGWPDVKVAFEYDGWQHRDSEEQWETDISRREDFEDWSWRMVVATARRLGRPAELLDRVVAVLRSRGMDVAVTSQEWRKHFPEYHDPTSPRRRRAHVAADPGRGIPGPAGHE